MNRTSNNIQVGSILGIPFFINPSWFIVLALGTWLFGQQFANFPQINGLMATLLGLSTALLLFASVLAHELGHSIAALSQGIEVRSITLFLFGGLAMLEKESDTPFKAFLIAIAGPAVSFLLCIVFTLLGVYLPLPLPLTGLLSLLASINLVLGIFNLIPGLPLDGGNILKALVWQVTGNPNKGLLYASRVGQGVGIFGIMLGLLGILGISSYGSFWTLLIGLFLLQNAGLSAQSAQVQETLDHYTAQDAITPNSPVVSADLTLREFVNNYVIGHNPWSRFLITNEAGELMGELAVDQLKTVPTSLWTETRVQDLMQPTDMSQTVSANESLLEVVKRIEEKKTLQLTVLSAEGKVLGLVEKASILELLSQKNQPSDSPVSTSSPSRSLS
ncbi:site-2 protease family protein [Spirulina subsalsa FACHB-351]|uniref:Zinc metalloprotease n=1 Tax=Spirulina subsalsa FACHB-351 TaxID=234711 RepID=A0ABT3L6Y7_9CYAN|nr:site-2 protease family protein [Spirulina subsalsa]MCW6037217.1 site-2 protease family protein [Spirulina subsalsa FACHB-351]